MTFFEHLFESSYIDVSESNLRSFLYIVDSSNNTLSSLSPQENNKESPEQEELIFTSPAQPKSTKSKSVSKVPFSQIYR